LREAEAAGDPAQRSRAERAFNISGSDRTSVRMAEPRRDIGGEASGSQPLEETTQSSLGLCDDHEDFFDERPGIGAKSVPTSQVVDQGVERRHVFLPKCSLPNQPLQKTMTARWR
jgi:hypothetical protein